MIDWVQGTTFPTDPMPGMQDYDANSAWWSIQGTYGGWFHVYAFTMTMGIILAVAYSAWKFYRKGIPLTQLALGVVIIVPCSLFGASIFGKLNAIAPGVNADYCSTAGLFAFWHAGMAIHGGVYIGTAVGVITFGIMGYFTKTSLWVYMDAIIPNILLGQGLGRWGNFFNHEVMGAPLADVGVYSGKQAVGVDLSKYVQHLPHYIEKNTSVLYTGGDQYIHGVHLISGHVYEMQPIFLWESIFLLIAWGLITFVIPNIGKWFGPKPWKKYGNNFKLSWKQTFLNCFMFWKFPTKTALYEQTTPIYKEGEMPSYKEQPEWAQSWFVIWKQAYEYNPNYDQRSDYENVIKEQQLSPKNNTIKRNMMGKALTESNNPDRYWTTKPGIEACAYFLAWNVVRFSLELQRPDDHLFIMFEKTLSLCLIGVTGLLGLIGMILTQTRVTTRFFRQPGYLYEKEYFRAERIQKHWWFFITNLKNKTIFDMRAFLNSVVSIMCLGILISTTVMYGTDWSDRHWVPAAACEFAFATIAAVAYGINVVTGILKGKIRYKETFAFLLMLVIWCISIVGMAKSSYPAVTGFEYAFTPISIWLGLLAFITACKDYNAETLNVKEENEARKLFIAPHVSGIFKTKFERDSESTNGQKAESVKADTAQQRQLSAAELRAEAKLAKMSVKEEHHVDEKLLAKQARVTSELAELESKYEKLYGDLPDSINEEEPKPTKPVAKKPEVKKATVKPAKVSKPKTKSASAPMTKAEIKQARAEAKLAKMEAKQKAKKNK